MTTNTNYPQKKQDLLSCHQCTFYRTDAGCYLADQYQTSFHGQRRPDPSGQCASFRGGNAVRQKDRSYRGSFRHGAVRPHERMDRMGAIHVYYRRLHGLRGRSSGRKEAV